MMNVKCNRVNEIEKPKDKVKRECLLFLLPLPRPSRPLILIWLIHPFSAHIWESIENGPQLILKAKTNYISVLWPIWCLSFGLYQPQTTDRNESHRAWAVGSIR